jgi:hypothetical protein
VRERVQHAGVDGEVHQEMSDVDVASRVLCVATQVNASLIVVGLHRRSAVGKAFLGSTAQRIILSAACPVLSVPRVHPVRGGQRLDHGVPVAAVLAKGVQQHHHRQASLSLAL